MQKKYEQVMEAVSLLIRNGAVQEGEKIPSVRAMAERMQLSMMTVLDAYRRLEADKIIESVPRSGYRVLPESAAAKNCPPEAQTEPIRIRTSAVKSHAQTEELLRAAARKDVVPLGAGLPVPKDMPCDELSRCAAREVRTLPEEANGYELGGGDYGLRRQIARYMADSSCPQHPDDLLVTSGITQGLILALRAVTSPGDLVAVESPGYYGFFSALNFLNLNAVEIPSSPTNGIDIPRLTGLVGSGTIPKALIVAPTCANPSGSVIPESSRKKLVALTKKNRIVLIEDDTYGNLYFDNHRPAPLKAFSPDDIIYLGSFSKTIAPGYRIGWVAGGKYADDIRRCYAMSALALPVLTQRAVCRYLEKGGMNRHLQKLRRKYQSNIGRMQEAVAEHFPEGTQSSRPAGGHFLWIRLPGKSDALVLAKQALKKNISIAPGPLFSSRQHYKRYFRLNCALTWSTPVAEAVATLGKLANRLHQP